MKLIKVEVKKTFDEFKDLLSDLRESSNSQFDMLDGLIDNIKNVGFIDDDNMISFFCTSSDYNLKRLSVLFTELSINFTSKDLTDKVLLCENIKTSYLDDVGLDMTDEINNFINDFYVDNITIDDILDKINIKGVESINDIDKGILESIK
jgi:hypothetical protein